MECSILEKLAEWTVCKYVLLYNFKFALKYYTLNLVDPNHLEYFQMGKLVTFFSAQNEGSSSFELILCGMQVENLAV